MIHLRKSPQFRPIYIELGNYLTANILAQEIYSHHSERSTTQPEISNLQMISLQVKHKWWGELNSYELDTIKTCN